MQLLHVLVMAAILGSGVTRVVFEAEKLRLGGRVSVVLLTTFPLLMERLINQ